MDMLAERNRSHGLPPLFDSGQGKWQSRSEAAAVSQRRETLRLAGSSQRRAFTTPRRRASAPARGSARRARDNAPTLRGRVRPPTGCTDPRRDDVRDREVPFLPAGDTHAACSEAPSAADSLSSSGRGGSSHRRRRRAVEARSRPGSLAHECWADGKPYRDDLVERQGHRPSVPGESGEELRWQKSKELHRRVDRHVTERELSRGTSIEFEGHVLTAKPDG